MSEPDTKKGPTHFDPGTSQNVPDIDNNHEKKLLRQRYKRNNSTLL